MSNIRFTVVIVTYNRLDCLKKAIECYESQTLLPTNLIIVNNASTDGTADFLNKWELTCTTVKKIVINNKSNLGGAGGFSVGVGEALKTNGDFIFLADDDAYAENRMLEKLNENYQRCEEKNTVVAMCTAVKNFGEFDCEHRRKIFKNILTLKRVASSKRDYEKEEFLIDEFSFVGVAVKYDVVKSAGLPRADYFIYYDDTEYSHRIGKFGKIVCVPSAVMNHNVACGHDDNLVTWRSYYSLRNSLDVLNRYYPHRYFIFEALKHYLKRTTFIARILKKRTDDEVVLLRTAIKDAKNGNLGISGKYNPF